MRRLLPALVASAVLLVPAVEMSRPADAAPAASAVTEVVYLSLSGLG
jgi:hypothetical protein